MEIKNNTNAPNEPTLTEALEEKECSNIINDISEAISSNSESENAENEEKSTKKLDSVADFDQILTDFLVKYEKQRENDLFCDQNEAKEDFYELFPQRSLEKELESPEFKLFCQHKGKNVTYGTCYKDFCALVESIEQKTEKRVLLSLANKKASVGSISSDEVSQGDFFTKEQVLRMSSDQIKKNYNKIRESQQKW